MVDLDDTPYQEVESRPVLCPACGGKCDWWMGVKPFECPVAISNECWSSSHESLWPMDLWYGPCDIDCVKAPYWAAAAMICSDDLIIDPDDHDVTLDLWDRLDWIDGKWVPRVEVWQKNNYMFTADGDPCESAQEAIDGILDIHRKIKGDIKRLVRRTSQLVNVAKMFVAMARNKDSRHG